MPARTKNVTRAEKRRNNETFSLLSQEISGNLDRKILIAIRQLVPENL